MRFNVAVVFAYVSVFSVVGCGESVDHVDDVVTDASVILPYYQVTIDVTNNAADERYCDFRYSFQTYDMRTVNGPQVPLRIVGSQQSIGTTVSVPMAQVVALTAACWHPEYPDGSTLQATASLRTDPLHDHIACHGVYSEANGIPAMVLSCQ